MMIRRQRDRWLLFGIVALGIVLCAPPVEGAQQTQIKEAPARAMSPADGKENFTAYCAVCHGNDAKGNGPAAPALKGPIPDLTTIAKRNAGKFDAVAMQRVVSGVDKPRPAHGTVDMPIWGPVFRNTQGDQATTLRVTNLVKYLESLQQK
jgi:mono/diheme cytochrome c family protein